MTATRTVVLGCGGYLPEKVLTNDDLSKIVDTSDEWIVQRTGIRERRIAAQGETTADLGENAARAALANAGLAIADIDVIIVATSTPNHTFPATAVEIQNRLGMHHGFAFDSQAVCTGFIYALTTADQYIRSGFAKRILVIGSETFSRILDWSDRTTCVLFGDGAGAVVVEVAEGAGKVSDRGILTAHLRSDGAHREKLYVDGGPSTTGTVGHLRMEGREVFKNAVRSMSEAADFALQRAGLRGEDVDLLIPHQANMRIIEATAKYANIPMEKVFVNVDRFGNMSSATIPVALDEAVEQRRLEPGMNMLTVAFGAGFTWGAMAVRW